MDLASGEVDAILICPHIGNEIDLIATAFQLFGKGEGWKQMTASATRCNHDHLFAHALSSRDTECDATPPPGSCNLPASGLRLVRPRTKPMVSAMEMSDDPP